MLASLNKHKRQLKSGSVSGQLFLWECPHKTNHKTEKSDAGKSLITELWTHYKDFNSSWMKETAHWRITS